MRTRSKRPLERSRLRAVTDWCVLAAQARYHPKLLAELCGVSLRELERFFRTELERSPRNWLEVERLRQAARMLSEGRPQKDIAAALAFSHPSHFIRRFTESYGCAPGAWLRRSRCATPRRTRGAGVPDRSRR